MCLALFSLRNVSQAIGATLSINSIIQLENYYEMGNDNNMLPIGAGVQTPMK